MPEANGQESETLNWNAWDVSEFIGQMATIKIIDQNSGGWGHINADQFLAADEAALPTSSETAVNLIVDGEVVRSATGEDSEQLHWTAWNVGEFTGQDAQIQIVDQNTGGWGHLPVDHIVLSDEPKKRADWIDFGRDFYAVVSYENVPGNKRIWVGWMNNWDYANQIPTSPWRSAQALPRGVALAPVGGEIKLIQQPVEGVQRLKKGPAFNYNNSDIPAGTIRLDGAGASGSTLVIEAELEPRSASSFGLNLAVGNGERTVVGYDVEAGELFVDRTQSGQTDFSGRFPSVERAPMALEGGKLKLTIFLDRSSVEVFGGRGETVITDQIFPGPDSTGVDLFAEGGDAFARKVKIMQMKSIW